MRFLAALFFALLLPTLVFAMSDPSPTANLQQAAVRGDEAALKTLQTEAENGDVDAQFSLGRAYPFVHESCSDVEKWMQRAAAQGHAQAQQYLATFYKNGCGPEVPVDYKQAYYWELLLKKTHTDYPNLPGRLKSDVVNDDFAIPKWTALFEMKLTPEEISEARKRVSEWKPTPEQHTAPPEVTGKPGTK